MKNLLISFIFTLFLSSNFFSQAPQAFSYQAVIRDASNNLIVNTGVGTRISIVKDSNSGVVVYEERHTPVTNANGLISLEIGRGAVLNGVFNTIDWSTGNYYVKSSTDPTGGTNYSIVGNSNLLSVPYALYAQNSGRAANSSSLDTSGCHTIKVGNLLVVYTSTNAYALYQSQGTTGWGTAYWTATTLSGNVLGAVASENKIVIYTSTNAYALYQSQGSTGWGTAYWTTTTLSGNVLGATNAKNNIVVYTSTNAYAVYQSQGSTGWGTAYWTATTLSGNILGASSTKNNIVVYSSTNVYGLYQSQGSTGWGTAYWTATTLSGGNPRAESTK